MKRRDFIKSGAIGLVASSSLLNNCDSKIKKVTNSPIILSTWNHGIPANKAAMDVLNDNGTALDAVEAGVRVTEADPSSRSVRLGGRPDQVGFSAIHDRFQYALYKTNENKLYDVKGVG